MKAAVTSIKKKNFLWIYFELSMLQIIAHEVEKGTYQIPDSKIAIMENEVISKSELLWSDDH